MKKLTLKSLTKKHDNQRKKLGCKASDMDKLMEADKESELKKRTGGVLTWINKI